MSNWAAIIYGRTYEVDFRLIVKPEDFEGKDIDWAKSHILVTTRWAEKLSDHPRWSMFKNRQHCIVGVTCMVSELSQDINEDRIGRPLYVFVGYVAKPPFPPIPPMNLELFKPIYDKYVRQRWFEKSYQTREADLSSKSEYAELEYSQPEYPANDLSACSILNANSDRISLWSDNNENRQQLWLAASQQQAPVSLCLGLVQSKDAIQGSFLNATALDVSEKIEVSKPKKVIPEQQQAKELPPRQEQDNLTKQKCPRGKQPVEPTASKKPRTSSKQNENETAANLWATLSAGVGFLSKLGNAFFSEKEQQQEQKPPKQTRQQTSSKQPEPVEAPDAKQRNPYSEYFKPKSDTEKQSEDAKKDDSNWL